ncbi:TRAP transporter substrate-binding protein DctP [Marinobacterium mangrovicola]|uniref:TRAP-type C4-dicarboxylate transport system substrate-binding protein n=1 Tax=Marinobacterium mangrovicola TaxID=1476959 RepID=A0A4R1GCC2_9GAMM|nr:TRAP transporter substrate-binding protein DctP [Marinobacterium mangrovicola]TCK05644.1 TRAP-type C4-dicarboxylate transport system substrate-binding protein [Marinobacterium mangrovicola]
MTSQRFIKKPLSLLKGLVLGAGLATACSLQAQTINLSYNGAPDAEKNAVHLFASNLKKLVEEKTGGELELKLYPNSMLGEEQERMEQVMNTPSLNIASFGGVSPQFPEIFVSAIPFMFDGFDSARDFFDNGEYWKASQEEFYNRTGARILAVVEEGGFLAFTNNERPIHSPADFDGLRFRAMDKSQVALFESFGASGTPIPWTEVYMALRTGVADGQMNPPMYIILGSLFEVQKYLTLADIQYSDQFLIGNGELIDSLSEEDRKALQEAVVEANEINREAVESQVESRVKFLEEQGMEVYKPTEAELAEFQQIGQPSYIEWLKEQNIDQKWIDSALKDAGLAQ